MAMKAKPGKVSFKRQKEMEIWFDLIIIFHKLLVLANTVLYGALPQQGILKKSAKFFVPYLF